MPNRGLLPTYVKLFKKYLDKYPLVFDAGCGYGRMFKYFPMFLGVDRNLRRLKMIKRINNFPNMICRATLNALPFRDRYLPASCTNQVLMHIPHTQIRNVLRELDRVTSERLVHIEYYNKKPLKSKRCFNHNLKNLYATIGWKMICYEEILKVHPTHGCWVFQKAD